MIERTLFEEEHEIFRESVRRFFERELAIYRALLPHLAGITFVTYGDKKDLQFFEQ